MGVQYLLIGPQVRGPVQGVTVTGSRQCFGYDCGANAPQRKPVRILPPPAGEEGVWGCTTQPVLEHAMIGPVPNSLRSAKSEL